MCVQNAFRMSCPVGWDIPAESPPALIAELRNSCTKLLHNRSERKKLCPKAALKHVLIRKTAAAAENLEDDQQTSSWLGGKAAGEQPDA